MSELKGWESADALYHSDDPNPIMPTHIRKAEKMKTVQDEKGENISDQQSHQLLKPESPTPRKCCQQVFFIELKFLLRDMKFLLYCEFP